MEGGSSLFNPGFLGGSFLWWIGQIADDLTWRKNKIPGKFTKTEEIPGWGERYKVRIVGLHDQGEEEIPSEELPWAQIMYPVTAGGGQANSHQTSNLRQGPGFLGTSGYSESDRPNDDGVERIVPDEGIAVDP